EVRVGSLQPPGGEKPILALPSVVAPSADSAVTLEPPAGAFSAPDTTDAVPPRITTRLSVRERVSPFDRYFCADCPACSGDLPSSTPLPSASKPLSFGSTWARSKRER